MGLLLAVTGSSRRVGVCGTVTSFGLVTVTCAMGVTVMVAMGAILLMQHLGLLEGVAVASTNEYDGGKGKQRGGEDLHTRGVRGWV